MAVDPVCFCKVEEEGAEYKTEYEGRTYYFCTPGCKAKFEAHPDLWAKEHVRAESGQ